MKNEISKRDCVNSFARGLEVIRAFTHAQPQMTLSDVARATGMTRATVRRFLLTLVREGYADTDDRYFRLRPKVLELGFAVLSSLGFLDVAQPILIRLSEKLRESCFVAILDDNEVVYVACASPPNRYVSIDINVGARAPAHCVSTGRVLIAALSDDAQQAYLNDVELHRITPNTVTSKVALRNLIEDTRVQGWSIVDQELEIGLRSISVPIRDKAGQVLAALNVACPSSRITPEDMNSKILLELQSASQMITTGLQR